MEYLNYPGRIVPARVRCEFCERRARDVPDRFVRSPCGMFICERCIRELATMMEEKS